MKVSIFYNQEQWHELLAKVINPFIETERGELTYWYISLDTNRGEHITVALDPENKNADVIKNKFLTQAGSYLSNSPSAINEVNYPLDGIFMDYPNNSIELDIDTPINLADKSIIAVRRQFSEILLEVGSSRVMDMESIFTFIIYLQLGIMKAGHSNSKRARMASLKLLLFLNTNEGGAVDANITEASNDIPFIQIFEGNKDLIGEIVEDIWSGREQDADLKWMENWELICRQFIAGKEFHEAFVLLSRICYEHLGLYGGNTQNIASRQLLKIFNQAIKSMNSIIRIA
jgi:hypothetical protein